MDFPGESTQASAPSFPQRLKKALSQKSQQFLDKSTPHIAARWIFLMVFVCVYAYRTMYVLKGFYIVTYGLGIFLLNLFIGFLTPLDLEDERDTGILPLDSRDEFKPFIRRLPEFKFWYSCTKALTLGFLMTFFSMFDVPVYWPILLMYFIVLFVLTMKRQIKHMIKHKYVPFSFGKKKYAGSDVVVKDSK